MSFSDRNTLSPYCSICQVTDYRNFYSDLGKRHVCLFGRSHLWKKKAIWKCFSQKTIEGFIGGVIFSLAAAFILAAYEGSISLWKWLLLAVVVVVTGTLGDLVESKFKRMANVKDSGAILPGHGGLLDRLDSLIFAAPFAYITLQIFNYVS